MVQSDGDALIKAYVHGIYPRSEAVVATTRDLDRGRTTRQAADQVLERELNGFVALQQRAGLDYFSDGLLAWQDIFRPLVDSSDGMRARTMIRWFDNNSFFRAPEVEGPVSLVSLPDIYASAAAVPSPRVATLPSPLLFSRASLGGEDPNHLMFDLARAVLRPLCEQLVARGFSLIHFQEPWLAYNGLQAEDFKLFSESLGMVTDGLSATTVLHTYFGDAGPWAAGLRDLPVDVVGIDFGETDIESLGSNWPKGLLIGCLDGRRSLLESVPDVVGFVRRVADEVQPTALYIAPNSDLELLGTDVAGRKVLLLGEVAARLKEELR